MSGGGKKKKPPPREETVEVDSLRRSVVTDDGNAAGRVVQVNEQLLSAMCTATREVFLSQSPLLELDAPVKICGDIHGQYHDLLRIFEFGGLPPEANYLFLGDYVDRGKQSLEVLTLMFSYKLKYPDNLFMLRGNHECASITRIYGFYDECKRRYTIKLWKQFCDVFNCMPICSVVEQKVICMHGGLSPDLRDLDQIRSFTLPTDVPDQGIFCDLLWSDPDGTIKGWEESNRGVSYVFGADVVAKFLREQDLELVCRAHQVVEDGYEFFAQRQLLTIFSAPNYCGEFDNCGAMLQIDETLMCSFQVLMPVQGLVMPPPQILQTGR